MDEKSTLQMNCRVLFYYTNNKVLGPRQQFLIASAGQVLIYLSFVR